MKGGPAVVPGTHMKIPEERTAGKLGDIDSQSIDAASHHGGDVGNSFVYRFDDCGAPVDGKHEKGGFAHHGGLSGEKSVKARPEDFHTPSHRAAQQKISFHHDSFLLLCIVGADARSTDFFFFSSMTDLEKIIHQ